MHNLSARLVRASVCSFTALAASAAYAQDAQSDREIVVSAQRSNQSQVLAEGSLGALGDKDALNVPFSVKGYDSTLILNQQSQTLGQVLDNDPSVRTTYGFANASEQFVIRGFSLAGEDIAIDGLYGITPRQLVSPELYDQVQILNGASAFLYGAAPGGTAVGGTVNLVPKRATGQLLARVTANYNSDQHFGGAFDFGKRFGADESLGVRINGAGRWGDISIDDEYRASNVIGISTDWRRGPLTISLDLGYQRSKVRRQRPMVQVSDATALPRVPRQADINFGASWYETTLRDIFGIFKAELELTEGLLAYASVGAKDSAERGIYQSFTVNNSATGAATITGSNIPRNDNNESATAGVRANITTGSLSHEINVGASAVRQVNRNAYAFGSFAGSPTNLYDPVDVPLPTFDALVGGDLDNPFPIGRNRLFSAFISDTIGAFDDRLLLTLGARKQYIKVISYSYFGGDEVTRYDEHAITPVIGLVVKPTENISLYANRIEALLQGPSVPNDPTEYVNAGTIFAPFSAVQYEIGGKVNFGNWFASLALFETSRPSQIDRIDPTDPLGRLVSTLEGDQRHRGVEGSLSGEPVEGLRVIAGASYIDADLRRTVGGALDGNTPAGVPEFTANANVEWDTPFFPGFTLTGRVLHTSNQYFDATNTLSIPSWTRFDLGARYVFVAGDTPLTLRVNVDNVADKSYWASAFGSFGGQLVMGLPRTVKASITADF